MLHMASARDPVLLSDSELGGLLQQRAAGLRLSAGVTPFATERSTPDGAVSPSGTAVHRRGRPVRRPGERLSAASACDCGNSCLQRAGACDAAVAFCALFDDLHVADRRFAVDLLLSPGVGSGGFARRLFVLPFVGQVCRSAFVTALSVSSRFVDARCVALRRGLVGVPCRSAGGAATALPDQRDRTVRLFSAALSAIVGAGLAVIRRDRGWRRLYALFRSFASALQLPVRAAGRTSAVDVAAAVAVTAAASPAAPQLPPATSTALPSMATFRRRWLTLERAEASRSRCASSESDTDAAVSA
jgi:hypothetical protein